MKSKQFKSYSGDLFEIPVDNYNSETAAYQKAVEEGDESAILKFEEGTTGWKLLDK